MRNSLTNQKLQETKLQIKCDTFYFSIFTSVTLKHELKMIDVQVLHCQCYYSTCISFNLEHKLKIKFKYLMSKMFSLCGNYIWNIPTFARHLVLSIQINIDKVPFQSCSAKG